MSVWDGCKPMRRRVHLQFQGGGVIKNMNPIGSVRCRMRTWEWEKSKPNWAGEKEPRQGDFGAEWQMVCGMDRNLFRIRMSGVLQMINLRRSPPVTLSICCPKCHAKTRSVFKQRWEQYLAQAIEVWMARWYEIMSIKMEKPWVKLYHGVKHLYRGLPLDLMVG